MKRAKHTENLDSIKYCIQRRSDAPAKEFKPILKRLLMKVSGEGPYEITKARRTSHHCNPLTEDRLNGGIGLFPNVEAAIRDQATGELLSPHW